MFAELFVYLLKGLSGILKLLNICVQCVFPINNQAIK